MKVLFLALLLTSTVLAKDQKQIEYKDGILLALDDKQGTFLAGGATPATSVLVPTHEYHVTIAIGEMAYTGNLGRSQLKDAIIGDPIKAAVDDKHIYLVAPNGKQLKATIIQRARYKPTS